MSTPDEDAAKLGLGPTGEQTCDTLGPHDHGPLLTAVYIQSGKVVINFGTELRWVALTPDAALQLAGMLYGLARDLGAGPPDDGTH